MATRRDFTDTRHSSTYDYVSPLKLDLSGRNVLVTGAAWPDGVGYATATAFARAGAAAIATADVQDISSDLVGKLKAAAVEAGRPELVVLACSVDLAELDSVRTMHKTVSRAFDGRLDIVVNNAAHRKPYQPFFEPDPEVYWRTYEVNVRGLFNMARVFLPMQFSSYAQHGALCTMINVASLGALTARPGSSAYRSSKLSVLRWTESMQLKYEHQGLLAISVNPGAIRTAITSDAPKEVLDMLPDQPDLAGDTIAWLASKRREWLGGRYVSCPWDMQEPLSMEKDIVANDELTMKIVF